MLDTHQTTLVGSQLDSLVSIFQQMFLISLIGRQWLLCMEVMCSPEMASGKPFATNGNKCCCLRFATDLNRILRELFDRQKSMANCLPLVAINIIVANGLSQIQNICKLLTTFCDTLFSLQQICLKLARSLLPQIHFCKGAHSSWPRANP